MTYQVKGGCDIFVNGGKKTYFDKIIKNITKIFPVDEHIVEGYLIMFILDFDVDFNWWHFKHTLEPKPPLMPEGLLYYMDFVYNGDIELPNRNGRRYVAAVDPANDDMVDATIYTIHGNGELHHVAPERHLPNNAFNLAIRAAGQAYNLDLMPLGEDLEE